MEEIKTNKYQTPITEELLSEYPKEIQEQFRDFIIQVPFIRNLISPNRQYAKDRPRDKQGKIIVDLANPHILEDMDYFRPSALHYIKYGTYTSLKPNKNPNSEYGKWLREEVRRCWSGYVRPSDGEWVTGLLYFYLNYVPMMVTEVDKDNPNSRKASRIEGFPEVWEGVYWRFHCLEQARNGGLYNDFEGGNHVAELSRRGSGKSFTLAGIMAHNLILGESKESTKRVVTILTAYTKEYLAGKDGTLSKFVPIIDFLATNTQFPRRRLIDSINTMTWQMGYKDKYTGAKQGTLNMTMGVSSKDDESKLRGKRGYILFEEFGSFPRLVDIYNIVRYGLEDGDFVFGLAYLVGCVCDNTKVWTNDGRLINIQNLKQSDGIVGYNSKVGFDDYKTIYTEGITKEPIAKLIEPAKKECVQITLSNKNIIRCSIDHPILSLIKHTQRINGTDRRNIYYTEQFITAQKLKVGQSICELREIGIFGNTTLFDARFIGMLIGDGSYGYNNTPTYSSQDIELQKYIENNYNNTVTLTRIGSTGKVYKEYRIQHICCKLREIGIYGQTKKEKRLPSNYQTLTKQDCILLLSGLYDTDGSVIFKGANSSIEITQSNRYILEQIKLIWRKFGVIGSICEIHPSKNTHIINNHIITNRNTWFNLTIAGRDNMYRVNNTLNMLLQYKNNKLKQCINWFDNNSSKCVSSKPNQYLTYRITDIKNIGIQTVYNLSAAFSHTYLANNIITHNTAGDKDSDFHGAQELIYNPQGYNIYAIPNNWDKPNQGRPYFSFFFPSYVNRKGCYNKDGVSDIVKALLQILQKRYDAKYKTGDPKTIIKVTAEMPITPAEAIIKGGTNIFPVTDIVQRINEINSNPGFYDQVYCGTLTIKDNEVQFVPTTDQPIRFFPHKNNKNMAGALEIYEMPQKDKSGKVFDGRYILGSDPYDNDESTTTSLGSTLVLDLWTDRIVAEYTGRPPMADDYYEITRRMCIFYHGKLNYENNKKGLFGYFSKMNSVHLLTDVLDFLKDKQMVKPGSIGNTTKGTNASETVNAYARNLIAKFFLLPQVTTIKDGDQDKEVIIPNLYFIKGMALLLEASQWNSQGNFDRISAMGMLMLLREDKLILSGGKILKDYDSTQDKHNKANDDFFNRNYKSSNKNY